MAAYLSVDGYAPVSYTHLGGGMTQDKLSAFQTLYTCLETVAKLMAPIAPFYADMLLSLIHILG